MLTRAAPAIARSLGGVFNDQQAAQFLSSVGQCAQPLQHRGGVSFARGAFANAGGVSSSGGWNPADYPDLFPDAVQAGGDVEAPSPGGYRAGDWYSNYYGSPYFDLTTQLQQTLNQYMAQNTYEGDTVTIQGNSYVTNLTTNSLTAGDVATTSLNGEPLEDGPSGAQGARGLDGAAGAPGVPGALLIFNQPPANFNQALLIAQNALAAANAALRQLQDLRNRLAAARVRIRPHRAVQGVTFDPDACDVKVTKSPALRAVLQL